MENDERPSKLRKLEHSSTADSIEISIDIPKSAEEAHNTSSEDGSDAKTAVTAKDVPLVENGRPLSKNAQKKLKKAAQWEEQRAYRKAKRKDKMKEKKERKREIRDEALAAGLPHPFAKPKEELIQDTVPIAFVIDCGYDDLMVEKEIISLGSQITRSYSDMHKARYRGHLYISGWGEKTQLRQRFDGPKLTGNYKRWRHTEFVDGDFIQAAEQAKELMSGPGAGRFAGVFEKYFGDAFSEPPGTVYKTLPNGIIESSGPVLVAASNGPNDNEPLLSDILPGTDDIHLTQPRPVPENPLPQNSEIIYLSSDSPYTLTELRPYNTYVIGGLVDKNRHKGICYKTACDKAKIENAKEGGMKVRTAKLPISQYMQMTSRHVLATSHVLEIMLEWLKCGDWGQAFLTVLPKRKGARLKDDRSASASTPRNGDMAAEVADDDEGSASDGEERAEDGLTADEGALAKPESPNHALS